MAQTDPLRRDTRHCPNCGEMGVLPLDQSRDDNGGIDNPVMICPVCDDEFRATGMKWLGASRPSLGDLTDEDIDEWAEKFVEAIVARAERRSDQP